MLDHIRFTLIHEHNTSGSYAILFFTARDFSFTTRHIHNWASFLLWPSHFFPSGAVSSCSPLFPSLACWMPSDLGGSSCSVISFYLFLLFMVFSRQEYWSWLPFHSLVDHFCQHSSLWPIHLGWLCISCLMASLSWEKPFITTRLWSIPVTNLFDYYSFAVSFEISNGILPYYIFFFWLFGYFGVY